MRNTKFIAALAAAGIVLAGCSDADIASRNLSKAANQFEINRRIVFVNGITDNYLLEVEGRCSINADTTDSQLEVTCLTGPDKYKKHYLGLSDNVFYLVEQLDEAEVDVYHYRLIFKPEAIAPYIDLETSLN